MEEKVLNFCTIFNLFFTFSLLSLDEELKIYQKDLVDRQRKGVSYDDAESWNFAVGFLYSLTVITTIGEELKMECIFVSILNYVYCAVNEAASQCKFVLPQPFS